MKRNFINIVTGTALSLTMANAAVAMEAKNESREDCVVGYLPLKALLSYEQTSKAMYSAFQDAPQYKALTEGWEDRIPNSNETSHKAKFLYLNAEVPEYKIHFATLWFNFFPLDGSSLKLSHYWGVTNLGEIPKLLGHLNGIYADYLQSPSQQPEFTRLAYLGQVITSPKVDNRLNSLDSIFYDVDNFSATQRNMARYNWIEQISKGFQNNPDTPRSHYVELSQHYGEVYSHPDSDPQTQMSVLYHLAEYEIKGLVKEEPDFKAAEEKFLTVLAHPKAHPFTKILANKYLDSISIGGK